MTAPHIVLTVEQLKDAVAFYRDEPEVVFDVETKGQYRLDPRRNQVFWLQLAARGRADVIPFGHPIGKQIGVTKEPRVGSDGKTRLFKVPVYDEAPKQLWPEDVFDAFEPIFFNPDITLWGHNVKFDLESIAKYYDDEIPQPPFGDTQIAAFLLNENHRDYRLGTCVKREFGFVYDKNVGKAVETYPFQVAADYAFWDARYTWMLKRLYAPQIKAQGLQGLFTLEMDILDVLTRMESAGSPLVDIDALRALDKELDAQLIEITGRLYRIVGRQWNFNSTPQKQQIFYGKKKTGGRGLRVKKRTPTGAPSCDKEALEAHVGDELVDAFLEYQEVHKISSTYVKAYLGNKDVKNRAKDRNNAPPFNPETGRIHANFKQHGAVTGRFSCVTADTLIDMPRDMVRYPEGVPITEVKPGDWVYSFDWRRELTLRQVTRVWQTGVRETVVVTFENSEGHQRVLRCTPDHLIRMRDGSWESAGALLRKTRSQARVMSMVRRSYDEGYFKFFPHSMANGNGQTSGGKNREHRWVAERVYGKRLSTKTDVHHRNERKTDNTPKNLIPLSIAEHRQWAHHPNRGRPQAVPATYCGPSDYRVISVEMGDTEPVWDMTVEEDHQFVANGIVVHNCSEPNLQNIPRPDKELGLKIRGLFIAGPGEKLIVADWAQIEYRILAQYSGDKRLINAFQDGLDFHQYVASLLLGKDMDKVTKVERTVSKNTNFAVVYGAGVDKIAAMSGVTIEQAQDFLAEHRRMLKTVYRFCDAVIDTCRRRRPPYVKTMMGRVRRLPAINSRDYKVRGYAERQAVNCVIQGSAADLCKYAMVRLDSVTGPGISLNLTVHDELVTTVPVDRVEEGYELVREAMMGPEIASLLDPVPLIADIKVVDRWSDAKE